MFRYVKYNIRFRISKVFLQSRDLHCCGVMSKQHSLKNKSKCVGISVTNEAT